MESKAVSFKLFKVNKKGELSSLFIDNKKKLPVGKWLKAKEVPTDGFVENPMALKSQGILNPPIPASKEFLNDEYPRRACIHDPMGILSNCPDCEQRNGTVVNSHGTDEA